MLLCSKLITSSHTYTSVQIVSGSEITITWFSTENVSLIHSFYNGKVITMVGQGLWSADSTRNTRYDLGGHGIRDFQNLGYGYIRIRIMFIYVYKY